MVKFHYKLKTKKTLENRKLVGQLKHKSKKGGKGAVSQEKGISKLGLE